MHQIVPEFILENYRAGRYEGSFTAASLFLDISGFSALTDALMGQGRGGAEVLAATMRAALDPLVQAIFHQGGMIIGFAGDSISALYPMATTGEPAPRRALASAGSIQRVLAEKPSFSTRYGSFRISAKVGLAIGDVYWGILRSRHGDRAVYYFRGEAVEEAARAEHHAAKGETVLTPAIRAELIADVETVPLAVVHVLRRVVGRLPEARSLPELPEDVSTAAVFAPSEVLSQDLPGEFRQTVHLFMRIPSLPEDELRGFIATFFEVSEHYGGLIDRIDFGDKGCNMIVIWGAPLAHENDIERALNFVLDLQSQAKCPVTAGVTYFTSYSGYIGGQLFETYTSYGWGISLAARFMTDASDGDVWLDERIFQRVKGRFEIALLGERSFKGFAQKQKVYALKGRKPAAEMAFRGKLVGRDRELQALTDFVAPLWSGKYAGVLGIWGEAGMGKSRLVHEFRRSPALNERNCRWALCQADEILRRSFNPFRYWLFHFFEILPSQDPPHRMERFIAKLEELIAFVGKGSLAADLKHARPFLAPLVDLEWPDSLYEQLDAQGRYDNTILSLIALLKAESLRQPLIVFIEDAQYLDEDTKAFVPRLKRALVADPVSYPIAILMTTRWEGTQVLLEDGLVDRDIDLSALGDESIAVMSEDILGKPPAPNLTQLINERAEGNPFYAEQILLYLQDQNALDLNTDGQCSLKRGPSTSALPADISAMLVARLDRLPARVKEVIQAASVLGRAFELPVLKRMFADGDPLQFEIAAAERAAVWSALSETRYIFAHELLRDVAYNMQLKSRRQHLHALAFQALRDSYGNEKHRHNGALAYHSEQAGLFEEARRYLELAGNAARDGYHNAQAMDFYRRALAIQPAAEPREQYRLHRERERIAAEHGTLVERGQEIDAMRELADLTAEPGSLAEVALLRSQLLSSGGQYEKGAELAKQANEMAVSAGRYDLAIGAHMGLMDAYRQRGLYQEAMQYGEAAIALARERRDSAAEADILNKLGMAFLEMKNPSTARQYFEQSLSIVRAEDHVRGMARVLTNLGNVSGYQGNYTTALDYYYQALRLAREIGSRVGESRLLANLGWISGLLGDFDKAQSYARLDLQIAREIGDRYTETISLINLSSHVGSMGEHPTAIEYAEQGLALARQSHDRHLQGWALTYLGHGLLGSGSLEPARTAYAEAVTIRTELAQPALSTEPAAGLARVLLLQGNRAGAATQVDNVLRQLEQDGTLEGTDQPLRVYLNCYLVLDNLRDPRANRILNTAHDMLKTRANGISDPSWRQLFLENITYNREILSLWRDRH